MAKEYRGIDVSLFQGKIDYNRVRNSGIDFVIVKSSQGRIAEYDHPFEDPEFRRNMAAIKSAGGLFVGIYHYFCARNEKEAEDEANFFIRLATEYKDDIVLWTALDVEDSTFLPQSKDELNPLVRIFCKKVKDAGLRPMIYANSWWLDNRFDVPEGVSIWEANWSAGSMPSRARIWQYSSTGQVDGIYGNVDMNIGMDIVGDANGDGVVNGDDSELILQKIAGWDAKIDTRQADINGDGKLNTKDAIEIMRNTD